MNVTLVKSSLDGGKHHQILASYLINDTIVLDAGCVGFATPLDVQRRIKHVLLSHSHIDHIASLPIFIDNVYEPGPDCVTLYGSQPLLQCLDDFVFNDQIWPDMIRLSMEETPFLRLQPFGSGETLTIEGLKVTAVELDHIIPTQGFVIAGKDSAVAFVSDTSPTDQIWHVINNTPNLKAVFLEASFPNSMACLADKAHHLTPAMFHDETRKLNHDVLIIAIHIKPSYETEIVQELQALNLPKLEIGEPGRVYEF